MYYRYELWIEGEDQGIGFLQGIDELDLDDVDSERLLDPFDRELPMPPGSAFAGRRCISWFTEEGRQAFEEAIADVVAAFAADGIFDIAERVAEDLEDIVYEDEFQVLTASFYDGDPNLERASLRLC